MPNFNLPFAINDSEDAIILNAVEKIFRNTAGEFTVLNGINLTVKKGDFVSIVGKSGSGKSTLLNMITGIDRPSSGDVIVGGTHLHQLSESQRALWRGKTVGIVFQFFQLLPTLSLLENVILPMDYCNVYPPYERIDRANALLQKVGLHAHRHKLPSAVSTGQQQSAAIARALANDPPIIVADEPTGNLDTQTAGAIIELFEQLICQNKTILMVTHDSSLTEKTKRTILISDGELINPTVIRALPLLTHRQMLNITRQLEHLSFARGQPIIEKNEHLDLFYMIANGLVEVVLKGERHDDLVITCLQPGDFFGEVELISGHHSIASIRASSDTPVEIVALRRNYFLEMLESSPLTEQAICKIVEMKIEEHRMFGDKRK